MRGSSELLGEHPEISLTDKTLTITFRQEYGFNFFSSVQREIRENGETSSVVFNYEADNIYIGTFGYRYNQGTNEESDFSAHFFLGLTEENFYQYYKESQKVRSIEIKHPGLIRKH